MLKLGNEFKQKKSQNIQKKHKKYTKLIDDVPKNIQKLNPFRCVYLLTNI